MSQRSEKLRRQVERLKTRVDAIERYNAAWDAAETAAHNQAILDATTERNAERRRAREAERTAAQWKHLTYEILIGCIICLILANMAVHAKADDAKSTPDFATPSVQAEANDEIAEDFENELIEAALLARAHVIENCAITFYCNERYPHICGTGDGIAADGTSALAWATCAVDPAVIPLGSTVLVDLGDSYGLRTLVANDTGVKGNSLDICVGSHAEAEHLGRRTATVYWCEE